MKSTSSYYGYIGLYELHVNCIMVHVYLNDGNAEKLFGFSTSKNEGSVEYEFRDHIDSYINKRPKIYKDLKRRQELLNIATRETKRYG